MSQVVSTPAAPVVIDVKQLQRSLRRPRSLVEELDEHGLQQARQDEVLQQAQPSASRRQLIVE